MYIKNLKKENKNILFPFATLSQNSVTIERSEKGIVILKNFNCFFESFFKSQLRLRFTFFLTSVKNSRTWVFGIDRRAQIEARRIDRQRPACVYFQIDKSGGGEH